MRSAFTGVLILFWVVVGYVASLWAAKRFFSGRYRPEVAAAAVVMAFVLGANWPHRFSFASNVPASNAPPPNTPVASGAAATPPTNPVVDVGAACATARLTKVVGKGNLDRASLQTGTSMMPAGSEPQLRRGDTFIGLGWAANETATAPATAVCVLLDGAIVPGIQVLYGGSRPDVASALRNAAMAPTAFEIHLPSARVQSGTHRIQAAAVMADGTAQILPGEIRVTGPVPGKP